MKKIWLAALGILFFASVSFAQNYYAMVEILIQNDAGRTFSMNTITKVDNAETCQKVLYPINQLKDMYPVKTGCLNGPQWDKAFADIFADKPATSLYISYKDLMGHETRINSKVLTNENSSAAALLVDPPEQENIAWANAMLEALKKGGNKDARIIYPAKK
jgi:hypothetical protein